MSEFIKGVENGNDGKLIVPSWGKRGKWYKVTLEKEDGKYSVKDYDSELPTVTATDYGVDIATSKDGKDFHLITVAIDPNGKEPFVYPAVGKNITSDGVYAVDFNKPNTNVSLKINDTAATVSQTVNGLVQKNINLSASVGGGITANSYMLNNELKIGAIYIGGIVVAGLETTVFMFGSIQRARMESVNYYYITASRFYYNGIDQLYCMAGMNTAVMRTITFSDSGISSISNKEIDFTNIGMIGIEISVS